LLFEGVDCIGDIVDGCFDHVSVYTGGRVLGG